MFYLCRSSICIINNVLIEEQASNIDTVSSSSVRKQLLTKNVKKITKNLLSNHKSFNSNVNKISKDWILLK